MDGSPVCKCDGVDIAIHEKLFDMDGGPTTVSQIGTVASPSEQGKSVRVGELAVRASPRASGRIARMAKPLNADDILPLVACLTPQERLRLLRLITVRPGADDKEAYRGLLPTGEEFSSDEEPLAWDSEGWEDVG